VLRTVLDRYRFFAFFFPSRAVFIAIATACFCGLPAARSVRMFLLIAFLLFPLSNGIASTSNF
jgi:hypothetical protein